MSSILLSSSSKIEASRSSIDTQLETDVLLAHVLGKQKTDTDNTYQSSDYHARDREANYTQNKITYTFNSSTNPNTQIILTLGTSRNLGSPAMLNANKFFGSTVYYGALSIAIGLGYPPSFMMSASMQLGKDRAKGIYKTQLDHLILKETQRSILDRDEFNADNIRYMDHRYIGGIANDNEAFSERANHKAMDELRKEMVNSDYVKNLYEAITQAKKQTASQETTPDATPSDPIPASNPSPKHKFQMSEERIGYRNTCLTTGKDLFGTSVQSIYHPFKSPYSPFVKQCIQDDNPSTPGTSSTLSSFENSTVYNDWLQQLESRVYYPAAANAQDDTPRTIRPSFLAEYTNLGPENPKTEAATAAAEKYIELQTKIFTNAARGMHTYHKKAKNHLARGDFSRHRTSQAAYENMLMEANGFLVSGGCKSSIDRAGVEYATRMAYTAYMLKFNSDPTNDWINPGTISIEEKNERQSFLATEFLRTYTNISIDVGENNRGVLATKTFDQFVPPEIKFAVDEMSKRAREQLKEEYQPLLTGIVAGEQVSNANFSALHTTLSPSDYPSEPVTGLDTRLVMLMVSHVGTDDAEFKQIVKNYLPDNEEKDKRVDEIFACRKTLKQSTSNDTDALIALLHDAVVVEHRARDKLAVEDREKLTKAKTWEKYKKAKTNALNIAKKGSALGVSDTDFLINTIFKSWIPTGSSRLRRSNMLLTPTPLHLLKCAIAIPLAVAIGMVFALTSTAIQLVKTVFSGFTLNRIRFGDALLSQSSLDDQREKIDKSRPKSIIEKIHDRVRHYQQQQAATQIQAATKIQSAWRRKQVQVARSGRPTLEEQGQQEQMRAKSSRLTAQAEAVGQASTQESRAARRISRCSTKKKRR